MKRFVIDASLLVKLFFEEDHSPACVRQVKNAAELLAPDLIWAEAASVVWKRVRRAELSAADAGGLLAEMIRVPIVTHAHADLVGPALTLGVQTDRTVYDCLYLALAIRENLPMLTGDERLANALAAGPYGKHVRFVGTRA